MRIAWILFACVISAFAQELLKLDQPVERELPPGAPHAFTLGLSAGDYVAGSIDQHGKTDLAIFLPNGSLLRKFAAPAKDGKRPFAFVAETAGTYRLELTTQAPNAVKYGLRMTEVLSLNQRLAPAPPQEKCTSPRLEALRKQFASGDRSTEAFWRRIAGEGTPLAEPLEKEPKFQLVTFLWRGDANTRNVAVSGSFNLMPRQVDVMQQLAGTDVWYLTLRMPAGARFSYRLSPNDPLNEEASRAAQRMATLQSDPLNKLPARCPAGPGSIRCSSEAELPGAVPQPWIVKNPATPAGMVEKRRIKSELLKNERDLSVYTPPGYKKTGTPYALLVVFDESAYLDRVPTPVILDNLLAASKIPPTVAVLIANPTADSRNKELPPNPDFADFLAKELIPWTRAHYHVTSDPRLTVVAGSSYGGIASTYAGLRHSEVFGKILCQSGSFWWAPDHKFGADVSTETGWLAKQFIKSPKLPLAFYMDAGSFEIDMNGGGGAILEPSRHMRDVLLAKGYEVHYQQFIGGHDYLSWRGTFADGLMALIGK